MFRRSALLATLLLSPLVACAEPLASCTTLFAGGQAPDLLNPRLAERTHALCYRAYAVLDPGLIRGPLWSAEHPTAAGLVAAKGTQRISLFRPDDGLPAAERAEFDDYARSGYDRGHMMPSGDMPASVAQQQSFFLANMVPQARR